MELGKVMLSEVTQTRSPVLSCQFLVRGSYGREHISWSSHRNQEGKMGSLLARDRVGTRRGSGSVTRDKGSVLAMSLKDTLTLR